VDIAQFEEVVSRYFASQVQRGREVIVNLDGKTLRGSIPAGESQGLHLLAAYSAGKGCVLMQVEVEQGENEVTAAPRLLGALDLNGKVVTGDAMFSQRDLSIQVVEGGGEYIWAVKENQPQLQQDIATLFEPEECIKGFSPAVGGFRTAETREKGHGRIERRRLTASSELKGYLDWPYAEQVFKVERHFERIKDGKIAHEVSYGVTSLTAKEAGPKELLAFCRSHWHIENGLHYRRDETLREDWCHLRMGRASHAMAIINNLTLGLLLSQGVTNVPQARRYYAARLNDAIRLVLRC
jgi:predicted transposase YbfD/YdcC